MVKSKKVPVQVVEGACTDEDTTKEFSVANLLEETNQTLDRYKPKNDDDAAAIIVTEGKTFTSIQFFNSEGEFIQYIGLTTDYVKRSK